jgi:hypothetical protein
VFACKDVVTSRFSDRLPVVPSTTVRLNVA